MAVPMYKKAQVLLNNSFKRKLFLCEMKFAQLFWAALRNERF